MLIQFNNWIFLLLFLIVCIVLQDCFGKLQSKEKEKEGDSAKQKRTLDSILDSHMKKHCLATKELSNKLGSILGCNVVEIREIKCGNGDMKCKIDGLIVIGGFKSTRENIDSNLNDDSETEILICDDNNNNNCNVMNNNNNNNNINNKKKIL